MAQFEIVPGLMYLTRDAWHARPDLPRLGHPVDRSARTHVIFHHTTIIDSDFTANLWETEAEVSERMQQLQTARPDLGNDVPYNFVMFLMNTLRPTIYVCEGRGEDRTGAHTKGHNTAGIGIALQGNFQMQMNMNRYVPLISLFLGWLKFNPNGPGYGPYPPMSNLGQLRPFNRDVFAHQDFAATDCPGSSLIAVLGNIRFTSPR